MGERRIGNPWRCQPHVNHRHALCPGPAVEIRRIGARAPRLTSGRSSRASGFFLCALDKTIHLIAANRFGRRRNHSALGYRPPAPEATIQVDQRPVMHLLSNWTT